jgi:ubiquinone biosynthesis protein UbiJ
MRRMNSWIAKRNSLLRKIKKHVKVKNAYAQEVEKNENVTKELSTCHDTISSLRTENTSLNAKVEKLNVCHDSITNLRNENASLLAKIDKLNESISSLRTENDSLISKDKDLNVCNDSISCLRDENAILHAKIEELNACKPSTPSVYHDTIVLDVEMLILMLFMITLP